MCLLCLANARTFETRHERRVSLALMAPDDDALNVAPTNDSSAHALRPRGDDAPSDEDAHFTRQTSEAGARYVTRQHSTGQAGAA